MTVIVINIWVGIPFTMLQTTGILKNIPAELYESAKVDGANAFVTFFKITLPYMLFVTTPYLITTFTGNINNFNIIYLLSGGGPTIRPGDTAGKNGPLEPFSERKLIITTQAIGKTQMTAKTAKSTWTKIFTVLFFALYDVVACFFIIGIPPHSYKSRYSGRSPGKL